MDFKSQIATSREQSKILLSLGLKPETADMVYHYTNSRVKSMEWELQAKPPTLRGKFWSPERIAKLESPFHKQPDGTLMTGEEIFDRLWGKDIPAWSLDRLLEIMPNSIDNYVLMYNRDYHSLASDSVFIAYDSLYFSGEYMHKIDSCNNSYVSCIEMIRWLIENNHLNKEYLKVKP